MPTTPLISAAELHARISTNSQLKPLVLDIRWRLGVSAAESYSAYLKGHVPGAVYVDLDTALAGAAGEDGRGGRHPMPAVDDFELAMAQAGVDNDRPVVCYDDFRSLPAARCWWLLRHFGKRDVAVLDGGVAAWVAAGFPLEAGPVVVEEGDFEVRRGLTRCLNADEAADVAATGVLIDGRPGDRFLGHNETVDPVAGHIPGARSLPAFSLLHDDGTFLPAPQLRRLAAEAGITDGAQAAAYCGSGVQAAHVALALAAAGVQEETDLYVGSWSDWITDPGRAVATG